VSLRHGASVSALEREGSGVSPLPPSGSLQQAYLHAGHLLVSREPCRVTTILGSCVAVALWDPASGVGGLNHFLLPQWTGSELESPRFGNVAVRLLIREVIAAGAKRRALQAKLFGGACVLRAFKGSSVGGHLGSKNVQVARQILLDEGIPIAVEDVEGERGRKLIFQTHDGAAWVRSL
jgi:chemotaxis protein CheD